MLQPSGPVGTAAATGKALAQRYDSLIRAGRLREDPSQAAAIAVLDRLREALLTPVQVTERRRRSWFPLRPTAGAGMARAEQLLEGVYLYGPVGRGKSTVMDLFFDSLPTGIGRRVHFHAFMLEVHRALHQARARREGDPLASVAKQLAAGLRVLCFDEFVVNNIADAMILSRLYAQLRAAGVVWVATSNFPPERLYEGGLQRDRFLPFIALVQQSMTVLLVDHSQDYRRLAGARLSNRYFAPITADNRARFCDSFALVAPHASAQPFPLSGGRALVGGRIDPGARAAWFAFSDLFEQPLGSEDFLALTQAFDRLFIADLPLLEPDRRDAAWRFMAFVDSAYEAGCELFLLAAAPPDFLYPEGKGSFEFLRTASRLAEMQSPRWPETKS